MKQDALENFIKYKKTNLLTTNDAPITANKISFNQNKLEVMVKTQIKNAIVRSRDRWVKN